MSRTVNDNKEDFKFSIEPIEKLVLIDQIIDKIEDLINKGELAPGNSLPSEETLSEMFNISRTSVRQALKALSVMGVLEISPGKRTFINNSIPKLLENPLRFMKALHNVNISEFFDARSILEIELIKISAIRATEKDLKSIKTYLDKLDEYIDNLENLSLAEFAFHQAVFESSKNRILSAVALSLSNTLFILGKKWQNSMNREDRIISNKQHHKIYECIKEKDPIKASIAMEEHLKEMKKIWERFDI